MSGTSHLIEPGPYSLRARRLGIHSSELLVFMQRNCLVCRAEGLAARAQVQISFGGEAIIATLNHVTDGLVRDDEVGISEEAWSRLGLVDGDSVEIRHPPAVPSLSSVRARIFGRRLDQAALQGIMADVVARRYSDVHLAAFVTACTSLPLDMSETVALTTAMVGVGDRLHWPSPMILDKHSVGGLPGNRTTPLVVSIVTAHGLVMPKTSSRAITSPAGTADTMETMTMVDLDLAAMRRVVETEGGCMVWGGAVRLSPADDIIIRVERALDLDPQGQLIASVLSKKIAAGSTHVVIDMPVGATAKVRSSAAATLLSEQLVEVAFALGLRATVVQSDGSQPVGRGIGPALEAWDILSVLRLERHAPADLADRATTLAGLLLELGGVAREGDGKSVAAATIADGRALAKFEAICHAQGGFREPPRAAHSHMVLADRAGRVATIDNRRIARVAKLAGAPEAKAAGVTMHVRSGDTVAAGNPLYEIHAESPGELAYSLEFAAHETAIIEVTDR
jgi:thymidine phosphorylase